MSLPPITHRFPRCSTPSRYLGLALLKVFGWRAEDPPPDLDRAVVIAAPHTSNWDFIFGQLGCWVYGIRWNWLGKESLFRPPLGWVLRALGGLSVDRSRPNGLVGEAAEMLRRPEPLMLAVPAEGTRGWAPYWKSGFYWIAVQAGVPIVLGFVDYRTKTCGFGTYFQPTGDPKRDMDVIRAFYATHTGKFPGSQGPIRLAVEDQPVEDP